LEQHPEPSAHFAHELVAHLYDRRGGAADGDGWLERYFPRAPARK
jgi:hypothetical protein